MRGSPKGRQAEARRCTEAFRDLLLGYKARLEDKLHGTGITLPQLRMLKAVDTEAETSAAAIARRCHVTPQTLQSILARATREGWIVRGSSERNGRFVTAALTPKGRKILEQAMEAAAEVEAEIWQGVPLATLQAMRETVESGLGNLRRLKQVKEESTSHPKQL